MNEYVFLTLFISVIATVFIFCALEGMKSKKHSKKDCSRPDLEREELNRKLSALLEKRKRRVQSKKKR